MPDHAAKGLFYHILLLLLSLWGCGKAVRTSHHIHGPSGPVGLGRRPVGLHSFLRSRIVPVESVLIALSVIVSLAALGLYRILMIWFW